MAKRGMSKAALRAQAILASRKTPPATKKQVEALADKAGVHWTTIYRLIALQQK